MNFDNTITDSDSDSNSSDSSDSSDSSSSDSDEEMFLSSVVAVVVSVSDERNSFFVRDRQNWESFAVSLIEESSFRRYYRMEKLSFYKLVSYIEPFFSLDEEMSMRRTNYKQPIGIEIVLHCLLRYLSGSSADDIRIACGISRPSFYKAIHQAISMILACPILQINFPSSLEEFDAAAAAFKAVSRNEIMKGCVGAVDGWLCRINCTTEAYN
jgi:hypothetical protein